MIDPIIALAIGALFGFLFGYKRGFEECESNLIDEDKTNEILIKLQNIHNKIQKLKKEENEKRKNKESS